MQGTIVLLSCMWLASQGATVGSPNRNDLRDPVLPAIKAGEQPACENPPDQQEILRAMPNVTRGVPYIYEEFRDDIEFTVEKLVDRIDPPRFYPLSGPAQLHHCSWKCTVYFTETVASSYPVPFCAKRRRAEVMYIDKDHLHQCAACPAVADIGPTAPAPAVKNTTQNQGVQQVELDVTLLNVDPPAARKITFAGRKNHRGETAKNVSCSVFTNKNQFDSALQKLQELRSMGKAKFLAEPRILTINGRPASFASGREVPFRTSPDASGAFASHKEFGIVVSILPILLENGKIHLEVCPEISDLGAVEFIDDPAQIKVQSGQAIADIQDGQTLAIRGLKMKDGSAERECFILVTARVVHPLAALKVSRALPVQDRTQPRRNQDSLEDVVKMAKNGVSSEIIIRQIETTNSFFDLTADDIICLHKNGVNDHVIGAMQLRRADSSAAIDTRQKAVQAQNTPIPKAVRNHMSLNDIVQPAKQQWNMIQQASLNKSFSVDYVRGYKDGFVNYLDHGDSVQPPFVPPQQYWDARYRTPEGYHAIEDWYAGFRHGVESAKESVQLNRR